MAPKEDPETAALRKELDDLIAKFKVWIFLFFVFEIVVKIRRLTK